MLAPAEAAFLREPAWFEDDVEKLTGGAGKAPVAPAAARSFGSGC